MTRANRDFASTPQPVPTVPGFTGGSNARESWGIVRMVDGHNPACNGIDGSNVHDPSAGDPGWHDPYTQYEAEASDTPDA